MLDLAQVTHAYFEALLERPFAVCAGDREFLLRLVEVRMLPPPLRRTLTGGTKTIDNATRRSPFSLYFRSEGETGLGQGTYTLVSPEDAAPLEIFLVPLGFEDGGFVYEAIFT